MLVFTFRVPCCDVCYDFRIIETMLGSSLLPVVCRRAHVLFTLFVYCLRIVVSNTYCFVFLFCFLCVVYPMLPVSLDCFCYVFFGLCTLYCQFLWIVFVLFFLVLCTLCCQFLWIVFVLFFFVLSTLCCQFLWIVFVLFSSSCVPYVASFS